MANPFARSAQNVIDAAFSFLLFWQRKSRSLCKCPILDQTHTLYLKYDLSNVRLEIKVGFDHSCPTSSGCSPITAKLSKPYSCSISPVTAAGVAAVIQLEETHSLRIAVTEIIPLGKMAVYVFVHLCVCVCARECVVACVCVCVGLKGTCNVITGGDYLVAVRCVLLYVCASPRRATQCNHRRLLFSGN